MPINTEALDAMMDHASVSAARNIYQEHCARQQAHVATVEAARVALEDAMSARGAMLMKAAHGDTVTAKETAAAETAVRQAEAHMRFISDLSQTLEMRRVKLQDDLTAAQAAASLPIVQHGARLRLAAAQRRDHALAELADAEAAYDEADAIVQHAAARGFRFNAGPGREFASPFPERGRRLDGTTETRIWHAFGVDLAEPVALAAE